MVGHNTKPEQEAAGNLPSIAVWSSQMLQFARRRLNGEMQAEPPRLHGSASYAGAASGSLRIESCFFWFM